MQCPKDASSKMLKTSDLPFRYNLWYHCRFNFFFCLSFVKSKNLGWQHWQNSCSEVIRNAVEATILGKNSVLNFSAEFLFSLFTSFVKKSIWCSVTIIVLASRVVSSALKARVKHLYYTIRQLDCRIVTGEWNRFRWDIISVLVISVSCQPRPGFALAYLRIHFAIERSSCHLENKIKTIQYVTTYFVLFLYRRATISYPIYLEVLYSIGGPSIDSDQDPGVLLDLLPLKNGSLKIWYGIIVLNMTWCPLPLKRTIVLNISEIPTIIIW